MQQRPGFALAFGLLSSPKQNFPIPAFLSRISAIRDFYPPWKSAEATPVFHGKHRSWLKNLSSRIDSANFAPSLIINLICSQAYDVPQFIEDQDCFNCVGHVVSMQPVLLACRSYLSILKVRLHQTPVLPIDAKHHLISPSLSR